MDIFQLMVFVIPVFKRSQPAPGFLFFLFCVFFFSSEPAGETFVYENKAGAKAKSGAERGRKTVNKYHSGKKEEEEEEGWGRRRKGGEKSTLHLFYLIT